MGWPGCPPNVQLGGDVWDLLRNDGMALRPMLAQLPHGALLLVVAGSPCQQLTALGHREGRIGLCGRTSSLFYVVPTLCAVLQDLRPDLKVHAVVENAGTMQDCHKNGILAALNVPAAAAVNCNARNWTAFGRGRLLASSLPYQEVTAPPRRPPPWEQGWRRRHHEDCMPPMTQARSDPDEPIRATTYQYAPRHLLYADEEPWCFLADHALSSAVRNRIPPPRNETGVDAPLHEHSAGG